MVKFNIVVLEGNKVVFINGIKIIVDVIVCCIGYKIDLLFLDNSLKD